MSEMTDAKLQQVLADIESQVAAIEAATAKVRDSLGALRDPAKDKRSAKNAKLILDLADKLLDK